MRPKILLGISSSYCAPFLKGQVNFLVKQGYDVVIISGPGEEISALAKQEAAKLITIPFTTRISPWQDLKHLCKVIAIVKSEQPDIINAGNPKSGFLIMLAAWWLRRKNRFFTMHGLLSDTKTGLKKYIIRLTEKLSCRLSHRVIVVGHALRQHAVETGIVANNHCVVLENGSCNGVDVGVFSRNEPAINKAAALSAQFKITPHNYILGFVGRLSKDKGIDLLMDAFNRLKLNHPELRLLIVGPLINEHMLTEEVLYQLYNDDNIFYTGKLQEVLPAYILMNVLVLPSLREGLANVILEASATEVPVVASDIPGCRDALIHLHTGELFDKGNVESLTATLEKMIQLPDTARQYGKNGRQFVATQFSNQKIWEAYLALYKEALS